MVKTIKSAIGPGEVDAYIGVFFDGLSKVLIAVGILMGVFEFPREFVFNRILPAIALSVFLGNFWYFLEAYKLSKKENRTNVTAQPFGIGAGQLFAWLFLIMAPVFWETGDPYLAWQVGLAGCFIGGIIEVLGAFVAKPISKFLPRSALLGNLASSAFVWLTIPCTIIVYENPAIALLPLLIYLIAHFGRLTKGLKLPIGLIVVLLGTFVSWMIGNSSAEAVVVEAENLSFYYPRLAISDLFEGLKNIKPYLAIIIPIQLGNFITTLQSLKIAEKEGDKYPIKLSMIADGCTTIIASLFGSPFPTTVYYGHTTWKNLGARSAYSLAIGFSYLFLIFTGLIGIVLAIIPYEVTVILLIVVGVDVAKTIVKESSEEYSSVFFIALVPVLVQYIQNIVDGILSSFGIAITPETIATLGNASIYYNGISILANGALLTSLIFAGFIAYVIKKNYKHAAIYMFILSATTFTGLTHGTELSLFPEESLLVGIVYLTTSVILYLISFKSGSAIDENQAYR